MKIASLLRMTSSGARHTCRVLLLASLWLTAPLALHAQSSEGWQVTDNSTHDKLDALYNKNKDGVQDIDTHARNIDSNFKIGNYVSPGNRLADPTSATGITAGATSSQSPFATATMEDGMDQCTNVAKGQQDTCKEIVHTQNAQYMYMTAAYANTATRNTALQALLTERQNIKSGSCSSGSTGGGTGGTNTCIGLLEDNTNKLMALYSLMALDRQQMESANHAYEARLRYLLNFQARLANAAATGGPTPSSGGSGAGLSGSIDIGNLISTAVAGGVMAGALATSSVNGPTLGIEKSNGF